MQTASEENIQMGSGYAEIIRVALPLIFSISIPQIHFFTNTFFLGQYSSSALAANAIAGVLFLIFQMSNYGLSNGIQILMSRRAGENDNNYLGEIFSNGILLGNLFCIISMLVGLLSAPLLFKTLINNDNIKLAAKDFFDIRILGLPILFSSQLCTQFFISIKKSKYIIITTIVSTLINIIADYLLINGEHGFSKLGIKGAAIGGILADSGAFISALLIILALSLHKKFNLSLRGNFSKTTNRQILQLSTPIILQYVLSIGAWELFFIFIEHLDNNGNSLAISQILRSVFGIVGIAVWGLANASNTMVSNLMGQQKQDEVLPLLYRISALSFGFTLLVGGIVFLFPREFLSVYTQSPVLIALGIQPLKILIVGTLLMSIATTFFNGTLGTGNSRINVVFEFTAILLYLVYTYICIEKLKLNLSVAWASELIYWSSLLTMSFIYLKTGRWKKIKL